MNVQINSIESLRKKILDLIEEMRINNKFNKVSEVQKLQKEYWKLEMNRDIQEMPEAKRNELLEYMTEFVPLGIKKGYFSTENIVDVLKQLTCGIKGFELKPNNAKIYGAWQGVENEGIFKIKKNLDSAFFRHVTMHELTHCVTMPYFNGNETYSTRYKIKASRQRESEDDQENKKPQIHVKSTNDVVFKASTIINELIAEATACDLCDSYKNRTYVGDRSMKITSDWVVTYNRTYQQLGDEFLQTLNFINNGDNTTDRKRFKALTLMALNPDNRIIPMIIREYKEKDVNGIDDLHYISECLEKMNEKPFVPQDVFDGFRKSIKKYMPENWREDEYLENVVETEPIHITSQSISNATRASIRINPGEVSKRVENSRIHIKTGIDKNNPNRNK